jgi:tRNA A-37 threonylcarbamoyl transferase component Bud32
MMNSLRLHFPDAVFTSATPNNHTNIAKFSHDGQSYFAKYPETDDSRSFSKEVSILKSLPDWWGLRHVTSYEAGGRAIIVTNALNEQSWRLYGPAENEKYFAALSRQLNWLHGQHIAHFDLALKNVLHTLDGPVIIDFDRSVIGANERQMRGDWKALYNSLSFLPNTRDLAVRLMAACPFPGRN